MDVPNTLQSYDTALFTLDQAQIDQVLREIEWDEHTNNTRSDFRLSNRTHTQHTHLPGYTPFHGNASQSSRLGSPGSMTTGSTNPSPLVPLLDYDVGFDTASAIDHSQPHLAESMSYPIDIHDEWLAAGLEGAFEFDLAAVLMSAPNSEDTTFPGFFPPIYKDASQQISDLNIITMANYTYETTADSGVPGCSNPAAPLCASASKLSTSRQKPQLACSYCSAAFTDKTKLKIHTNKHTKPFRCSAAGCDYSTAEKKSLQRHLLARAKWDEEHRLAAGECGLRDVKYRCSTEGCTYSTIREDNLKRHKTTCL